MTESQNFAGAVAIVPFDEPRRGIAWLQEAFGAIPTAVHPPEADQPLKHAEVRVGAGLVMIDDANRDSVFALRARWWSTSCWRPLRRSMCSMTGRPPREPRS